jgi:hypothetical protein
VNFRGKRRRKPPKFGGIFTQIRGGARHAYGYQNTCAGAFEKARNLKETRAFWRFRRNGPAKVDSFDRQRQLSRRRVQRALDDQWPNEPPFLQTLGEKTQAGAVLGQNLHVVGARGARAGARIFSFIAMDVGRLSWRPTSMPCESVFRPQGFTKSAPREHQRRHD